MKKLILSCLLFPLSCLCASAQAPAKSEVVATIDGVQYYMHTVLPQQTVYSLTRLYEVPQDEFLRDNPAVAERGLQAGMIVKFRHPNQSAVSSQQSTVVAPPDWDDEPPVLEPLVDIGSTGCKLPIVGTLDIFARPIREIALMLPLTNSPNSASMVELYQGVLIALAELKEMGYYLNLSLYDTGRSANQVAQLLTSHSFVRPDLIIGPVYDEQLRPAATYAMTEGIPIVSPLGSTTTTYGEFFYQLAPDPSTRYDKFADLLSGQKNIVILTTDDNNDAEFEGGIKTALGRTAFRRVVWDRRLSTTSKIEECFSADHDNVFIITSGSENGVDMLMAQLSSIHNRRTVKGQRTAPIQVIGSPRWLRYDNMDKNLCFKLNVSFATPYYASPANPTVQSFYDLYITTFGKLPTQYSERGYDAVRLFVEPTLQPLQSAYLFAPLNGNNTNTNWMVVSYRSDFTIEVR